MLMALTVLPGCSDEITFDLVLAGGRVLDPETGLDGIRDVGINGGMIAAVSTEPLAGARVIEVEGLAVAPGFIDLHQHEHTPEAYRLKAFDGVTLAIEGEGGVPDIDAFVGARRGRTPIHFGATANYLTARVRAWGLEPESNPASGPATAVVPNAGPVTDSAASVEQLDRVLSILGDQLTAGALGIGFLLEYTPGATRHEVVEVFRVAATHDRPVYVHVRSAGFLEPGSSIESLVEVIGAAAATGARVHVMHVNSTCMEDTPECIVLMEGARSRGIDITAEAYPYGVGSTSLTSALFNPGWQERRGLDFSDLEVPGTGERLTAERFAEMRRHPGEVPILIHINTDELAGQIIEDPFVMVGSDGLPSHPRNAGTFARVLARYSRDQGSLSLLDAVRKLSLMPAQRLEASTPVARRKGRVQVGADADIVVFDPETIQDNANFDDPRRPSTGVRYLIVSGQVVIDNASLEDALPGQAFIGGGQQEPQ
jgi:hypothetical protein